VDPIAASYNASFYTVLNPPTTQPKKIRYSLLSAAVKKLRNTAARDINLTKLDKHQTLRLIK
jgi:hypothetical protein